MILNLIAVICAISAFLFIVFLTDAIVEYMKVLKLNKLFPFLKIDEYFEEVAKSPLKSANYIEFISSKYWHLFIIRALLCPICLTPILMSLACSLALFSWQVFPIIYVGSILLYLSLKKLHG